MHHFLCSVTEVCHPGRMACIRTEVQKRIARRSQKGHNADNSDPGCSILDAGYWMLDTGYWMLDTGCWILDGIWRDTLIMERRSTVVGI